MFDELVCVCFGADGDKKLKIFKNSSKMHISDLKIKPLKPSNDQISTMISLSVDPRIAFSTLSSAALMVLSVL